MAAGSQPCNYAAPPGDRGSPCGVFSWRKVAETEGRSRSSPLRLVTPRLLARKILLRRKPLGLRRGTRLPKYPAGRGAGRRYGGTSPAERHGQDAHATLRYTRPLFLLLSASLRLCVRPPSSLPLSGAAPPWRGYRRRPFFLRRKLVRPPISERLLRLSVSSCRNGLLCTLGISGILNEVRQPSGGAGDAIIKNENIRDAFFSFDKP